MNRAYDAIVVGARCAGSPTAMLLARKGYRVLLVDRATFPSDTVSTHMIHPPGVAALARWGLLDRVVATGCPPVDTYEFDFGPFTISGRPATPEAPIAYAPRRTVLDALLVDAAAEAGVEVREQFTVESLVFEHGRVVGVRGHERGGPAVTERASVVVGADGRYSFVADAVDAEEYDQKPKLLAAYYSYWSGLPLDGRFGNWIRPHRGFAAWPTNDDLTLVIAGWPYREFEANRNDVEAQLPGNHRPGARLRRASPRRNPGGALRRRGRPRVFPQAVRPRLGTRRRCGLQQGLHHRAGHQRRLPRRRALRGRPGSGVLRNTQFRGRAGRVPVDARRARARDVRAHGGVRLTRARVGRAAAGPGSRAREPDGDGRLRTGHRRDDVARGVLLGGERGAHPGRGGLNSRESPVR